MLIILSDHDGITHSELAAELNISPAAATKVIKRLEERHYLQRRPDSSDERLSRVFLSDEGRDTIQQIKTIFATVHQIMLKDFSPEEQECLLGLLTRIYNNISDQSEDA